MSQILSVPSPVAEIKTAGATQAVDIVSPDNFTWRISIQVYHYTVVSPNKGTLKFCEIGSNKGNFPLFMRFPYLKNFDEITPKSPKPSTEIGFSDHSRQI